MRLNRPSWLKVIVHIASLTPLFILGWAFWQDQLGPDPIGELTRLTGRYALLFLLITLIPTAIKIVFNFKETLRTRRALGLYAFLYATLHMLIFVGLDYGFDLALVTQAVQEGPRVVVGLVALGLLLPLALTSTRGWMKRLGKNWRRLHRLIYLASGLAVLHYAWSFKELRLMPLLAGAVLILLLIVRIPPIAALFAKQRSEQPEIDD